MQENPPVTDDEYVLSQQDVIITCTDVAGRIVYANDAFLRSSGYRREDVMDEPQSMVQHPDMPTEAFRDMWATIGENQPWAGVVKDLRMDGGYYWVVANVTPVFEFGQKVGYMSVRTKPSQEQIAKAERLYAKLRATGRNSLRLAGGEPVRTGIPGLADWLLRLPVLLRLWLIIAALIAVFLLQALGIYRVLLPGLPALWQTWLLAALGTGLAVASGLYLSQKILSPLRALNASAIGVLCGHIQQRFPEQGDAQTRTLGRMLNQMNAKLVGILIDAKISIDVIRDTAKAFADGNAELANRTDEQASAIEQTTASLSEITETAEQNALGAQRANVTGRETAESAEVAAQEVNRTVGVMVQVRDHSRKISDITSVIDGIAFQTNIIALNASVEAARAGQYGRGFAVVAAEVRSLAQRAAGAAKEIKTLIETSLDTVTVAAQAATRAGETMNAVEQAVTRLTHTVRDIALASQGQSAQITQINEAVGQVAGMTQRNAALVQRSAAASLELQQQTQLLETALSVFQIGESHKADTSHSTRSATLDRNHPLQLSAQRQ